jgi:BirA family biotin operon repressor/biotin-[acetyl-CoA-carboxylase] ligase
MSSQPAPEIILPDLPTQVIGHPVRHYPQVGSTNELARRAAADGAAEGLVLSTDDQTAGRGRLGRGWAAPPGTSILMSALLRPSWLAPADAFAITMLAGVALCEAVEDVAPLSAGLKWPNDLLLPARTPGGPDLRKAAGILSEIELDDGAVAWVVIGIGVNVNWAPEGIVDGRDLGEVATSVGAAVGHDVDRMALLRALLVRLDQRYVALRSGARDELYGAWRGRLAMLGQPTTVRLPYGQISGVAEGVDQSGSLLVRGADGVLHTIVAGDVGG